MVKNLPDKQADLGSFPMSGDLLEREMATHSSILAWEIPWTEESGRLQSMESQRVGHDLMTERQQHQNQKGTNYIVPVCK